MEFPLCYLIVIMKSITHLFFDRRLRNITVCSSVLKCRTIVSINTFTKENNRRREEITGAPNENIVQIHLNIALLNVF